MKFSIVMAYHDRWELLKNTLRAYEQHGALDAEFILVDDASKEPLIDPKNDDSMVGLKQFKLNCKVIRINPEDKKHRNPCVPYNLGIRSACGEIVVLQNPECLPVGDILGFLRENFTPSQYISFACYSINKDQLAVISKTGWSHFSEWHSLIQKKQAVTFDGEEGWYNHSQYRPVGYHFASAVSREKIIELGGFDERYAKGIGFDDNELLIRIKRMGLKVKIIDSYPVIHQWHYQSPRTELFDYLFARNNFLFHYKTLKEKILNTEKETFPRVQFMLYWLLKKTVYRVWQKCKN